MINYFLGESGIFYIQLSGTVKAKEIEDYLNEFEKIDNLPQNLLTLYDLRKAKMDLKFKEILHISKLAKKATSSYKTVRTAFLVEEPNVTAYSILFTTFVLSGKTIRKVFSTEEAALNWLK